jgi:23S rRNA (cytidine1920-2'-O)/16S rRNA (cytidine1409-2'-O)-methyltransferase
MDKKRADQLLVEKKLAASRTSAQDLIKEGRVSFVEHGKKSKVTKPGQLISAESSFEIEEGITGRFVSRAGFKLEAALQKTQLNVEGFKVLDVGLSTGGFTDCLLQRGAQQVIGIEVGHGQTHPKLIQEPKLKIFEGINARNLSQQSEIIKTFPEVGFDLVVMDVSFISMTLIVAEVLPYLKKNGFFLGLVKPQFEVGPQNLGKDGVVKDKKLYQEVEQKIREALTRENMTVKDYFPSELEGKDGNQEYFILAHRS